MVQQSCQQSGRDACRSTPSARPVCPPPQKKPQTPPAPFARRHPTPAPRQFDPIVRAAAAAGFEIDVRSSKALAASLDGAVRPDDVYFNKLVRIMTTRCMTQVRATASSSPPPCPPLCVAHAVHGMAQVHAVVHNPKRSCATESSSARRAARKRTDGQQKGRPCARPKPTQHATKTTPTTRLRPAAATTASRRPCTCTSRRLPPSPHILAGRVLWLRRPVCVRLPPLRPRVAHLHPLH
eukprot:357506-Chlamydomonas_euryale.AAC.1